MDLNTALEFLDPKGKLAVKKGEEFCRGDDLEARHVGHARILHFGVFDNASGRSIQIIELLQLFFNVANIRRLDQSKEVHNRLHFCTTVWSRFIDDEHLIGNPAQV
jgi:hypothetical protein